MLNSLEGMLGTAACQCEVSQGQEQSPVLHWSCVSYTHSENQKQKYVSVSCNHKMYTKHMKKIGPVRFKQVFPPAEWSCISGHISDIQLCWHISKQDHKCFPRIQCMPAHGNKPPKPKFLTYSYYYLIFSFMK